MTPFCVLDTQLFGPLLDVLYEEQCFGVLYESHPVLNRRNSLGLGRPFLADLIVYRRNIGLGYF